MTEPQNVSSRVLKPCPFCGAITMALVQNETSGWWEIDCDDTMHGCGVHLVRSTRDAAIAAWSRRAERQSGGVSREIVADIIASMVSGPSFRMDEELRAAHRQDQLSAADAILALPSNPSSDGVEGMREAIETERAACLAIAKRVAAECREDARLTLDDDRAEALARGGEIEAGRIAHLIANRAEATALAAQPEKGEDR